MSADEIVEIEHSVHDRLFHMRRWKHLELAEFLVKDDTIAWVAPTIILWGQEISLWIAIHAGHIWLMPKSKKTLINKCQFERFFHLPMSCKTTALEDMRNYVVYSV